MLFGGFSQTRAMTRVASTKAEVIQLNHFHEAARNLPKESQDNIRMLRYWAKSRGYEKLANPEGGPEKWGIYEQGEFRTRLIIKPEGSTRPGLQPASGKPRFDAKVAEGVYINPFTGQTGSYKQYSHIPLDDPRSACEMGLHNKLMKR